jgi:hypothetical protein
MCVINVSPTLGPCWPDSRPLLARLSVCNKCEPDSRPLLARLSVWVRCEPDSRPLLARLSVWVKCEPDYRPLLARLSVCNKCEPDSRPLLARLSVWVKCEPDSRPLLAPVIHIRRSFSYYRILIFFFLVSSRAAFNFSSNHTEWPSLTIPWHSSFSSSVLPSQSSG